ncbi:nuclear transport factor 2 family protein [Planosporangium sp. 12N6]|uniref:nuclear transport factor 2 family protein n=1 Tax=Planosporangium spinosum TaxID=3402278 RepID=UPI003CEAAE1E
MPDHLARHPDHRIRLTLGLRRGVLAGTRHDRRHPGQPRRRLGIEPGASRRAGREAGRDPVAGTRIFRRTDNGWAMMHRHLSYPCDPQTGAARTDLQP